MSSAHITYSQRPEASAKNELTALANVYRFVLDCRAKKEAAHRQSRPDAEKGSKHDSRLLQSTP
jgi:hypothetical protein